MNKEVDLSKYKTHTDLAIEILDDYKDYIKVDNEEIKDIKITTVKVKDDIENNIKKGLYLTIEFIDITDMDNLESVKEIFIDKLKYVLKKSKIKDKDSCLIVGLGNKNSTPDSLGPKCIDNIITTNHLFELNLVSENFRRTYTLTPGVMSNTGIETKDYIKSITTITKPDFIIVIDALASRSVERLNKTIQISSSGIIPGSGVGNSREEISFNTLGIPVIAIGVPTVVDAATIVTDTINFLYKYYAYNKDSTIQILNKLSLNKANYLKKDINLNINDKQKIFGIIGNLKDEEIHELISEVLQPINYNLMVTTKEIDFLIDKLTELISDGINKSLHQI